MRRAERPGHPPLLIQDLLQGHPDQGLGHRVRIESAIPFRGLLRFAEDLDAPDLELRACNAKRVAWATATLSELLIPESGVEPTFGTRPSGAIPPCSTID